MPEVGDAERLWEFDVTEDDDYVPPLRASPGDPPPLITVWYHREGDSSDGGRLLSFDYEWRQRGSPCLWHI